MPDRHLTGVRSGQALDNRAVATDTRPLKTALLPILLCVSCSGSTGSTADALVDQKPADSSTELSSDSRPNDIPSGDASETLSPDTSGPMPGEFSIQTFTYNPVPGTGYSTGEYFQPAVEYDEIPLDSQFSHVLSFQLTPWAFPLLGPEWTNGPVVVYSDDLETIVFSPLNHPFISLVNADDGALQHGIMGDVDEIPEGFSHRFILVRGWGINATIAVWGQELLKAHAAKARDRYADTGVSYLGYWTDNGAAYFYDTIDDLNYEDTLLQLKQEADDQGLPYGYFQIDSWWYYRGPDEGTKKGGLYKWEPRPDVFPSGLPAFRDKLGLPLIAHNKWFIIDNAYRSEHDFVQGEKWSIPVKGDLYREFMANAVDWGIETYEPDWLMSHIWEIPWLRSHVAHAETWMKDQDAAAAEYNRTMQLCMAGAAHLMFTTEMPTVTTFRTSIDYHAGVSKESYWPMFHTVNMLASAVGVMPFKDNFHSSEPHGEAEALISNLSAGMVGVGDAFGQSVPEIILKTCRSDGLLLKPDSPATPIDAMFLPHERPYTVATRTQRPGTGTWFYVAAFVLTRKNPAPSPLDSAFASLTYDERDLGEMFVWPEEVTDWEVELASDLSAEGKYVAYDHRTGKAAVVEGTAQLEPRTGLYDFDYVVFAPVLSNGLALIGEHGKFVTMADRRFTSVEVSENAIDLELEGGPGEYVEILVFDTGTGKLRDPYAVTLSDSGFGNLTISR